MSAAALLSLLVALAKAFPALATIFDQVGAAWREHRRTQAHAKVDAAVAAAQAAPWECPPLCPHRALHERVRDAQPAAQPDR